MSRTDIGTSIRFNQLQETHEDDLYSGIDAVEHKPLEAQPNVDKSNANLVKSRIDSKDDASLSTDRESIHNCAVVPESYYSDSAVQYQYAPTNTCSNEQQFQLSCSKAALPSEKVVYSGMAMERSGSNGSFFKPFSSKTDGQPPRMEAGMDKISTLVNAGADFVRRRQQKSSSDRVTSRVPGSNPAWNVDSNDSSPDRTVESQRRQSKPRRLSTGSFSDLEPEFENILTKKVEYSKKDVNEDQVVIKASQHDEEIAVDVVKTLTPASLGKKRGSVSRRAHTPSLQFRSLLKQRANPSEQQRQTSAQKQTTSVDVNFSRTFFNLFLSFVKLCADVFWLKMLLPVLIVLSVAQLLPSFLIGFIWGLTFMCFLWVFVAYVIFGTTDTGTLIDVDNPRSSMTLLKTGHDVTYSDASNSHETSPECESDSERSKMQRLVYRGWMNDLNGLYDPLKYHVSMTRSVMVRLDKSLLRISRPRVNMLRHTRWNEERSEASYTQQKIYDIAGAEVVLRPQNLASRRWWSRKYPICIIMYNNSIVGSSGHAASDVTISSRPTGNQLLCRSTRSDLSPLSVDGENDNVEHQAKPRRRKFSPSLSFDQLPTSTNVEVDESINDNCVYVYLFARSGREKENWFHRLRHAACLYEYEKWEENGVGYELDILESLGITQPRISSNHSGDNHDSDITSSVVGGSNFMSEFEDLGPTAEIVIDAADNNLKHQLSFPLSPTERVAFSKHLASEWLIYAGLQRQFSRYMHTFLDSNSRTITQQRGGVCSCDLSVMTYRSTTRKSPSINIINNEQQSHAAKDVNIEWANALGARIFWDFLRDDDWINKVRDRIQRKLSALPHFIETLTLTKLEPGLQVPKIIQVYEPLVNEWGLWTDLKLEYDGGLKLVLETKVNLMKLKADINNDNDTTERSGQYSDNDVPESPESSADEDETSNFLKRAPHDDASITSNSPRQSTGKKLLQMVDKIAASKYFQEATENKYVKKVMQGISDTRLVLMVEVKYLEGTLSLNIPPPPTDRLWYGFRAKPLLTLRAFPKVGDKTLSVAQITDWIEGKLLMLFEKNLIIPNMDDLVIPVMSGCPLLSSFVH